MVALLIAKLRSCINVLIRSSMKQAHASRIMFLPVEMGFWMMEKSVMTKTPKHMMDVMISVK